jgi:hypothetical protein
MAEKTKVIKPIDPEDDSLIAAEDSGEGNRVLKLFLLIVAILFGLFYASYYQKNRDRIEERVARAEEKAATQSALVKLGKVATDPAVLAKDPATATAASTFDELKDDLVTAFQDDSKTYGEKALTAARKMGEDVLGAASDRVQEAAKEQTENVMGEIYKNTVGALLKGLIQQVPEEARDEVLQEIVPSASPTPDATPTPEA